MRIVSVEATPVAVPYDPEFGPVVTAGLSMTEARHVIVKVTTDEGVSGWGEALERPSVYGETVESILAALEKLLVPKLIGLDPCDVERLWSGWSRIAGNTTAKAALDVACHDIVGRAAGLPLYKLLGGWSDGRIELTMPIALAPEDEVVRQAELAVSRGFGSVKLKVGKDVARDVQVTEAVRAAVGDDVMLYVDANQGYTPGDAFKAARAYAALGVDLLEEPVAPSALDARVRLAQQGGVPLLLDESIERPGDALREIAHGTVGAFSIRSPRTGITWSSKLIGVAESAGVACLAGSHRELGVGTVASAHLAAAYQAMSLPAELGVFTLVTESLLTQPIEISEGWLTLPEGPGLGVDVDPEKLEQYQTAETVVLSNAALPRGGR
jgi:L-alanine-DL-glutamate epimerase-like enolase superfamily enzyme